MKLFKNYSHGILHVKKVVENCSQIQLGEQLKLELRTYLILFHIVLVMRLEIGNFKKGTSPKTLVASLLK